MDRNLLISQIICTANTCFYSDSLTEILTHNHKFLITYGFGTNINKIIFFYCDFIYNLLKKGNGNQHNNKKKISLYYFYLHNFSYFLPMIFIPRKPASTPFLPIYFSTQKYFTEKILLYIFFIYIIFKLFIYIFFTNIFFF